MTKEMLILILMEAVKCIIAAWVGYIFYKVTKILQKISDKL